MRIQNNIMALNTHRLYTINNNSVAKASEKLSSGYRVNRAGDDAAGLAISEKMRAQIRGLNMAAKNSNDAISMVQTAEGALQEVHSMLQRMNELAVQSATGTNESLDRDSLDAEFQQLVAEIDDIANQTTFNNMNILKGSYGVTNVTGTTGTDNSVSFDFDATKVQAGDILTIDDITFEFVEAGGSASGTNTAIDLGTVTDAASLATFLKTQTFTNADATSAADSGNTVSVTAKTGETVGSITSSKVFDIQVGALEGETMTIGITSMSSTSLGVNGQDVKTATNASAAITSSRDAINTVSEQRARLGAYQNRLEHKIANLDTSAENLQAAESRIRDVDMAKEMTNYTKNQILSQASTAMLAQANQAPQGVLQLLR